MPKLSYIVPVYNVEHYLSKCLDSILNQGFTTDDYEIILVNDGSKDHSQHICENYVKEYPNIHLYNKENGGVSSARNLGLENATGKFVVFIDADDYVIDNAYSYIFNNFVTKDVDIVRYWTTIVNEGTPTSIDYTGEIIFKGTGHEFIKTFGLETFCYASIYRRSYLLENSLRFKKYRIGEDFLFSSSVLLTNPSIVSTSCNIYRYVKHANTASTLRKKEYARQCVEDQLEINEDLINQIYRLNSCDDLFYKECMSSLKKKIRLIFSRAMSAEYSNKEFALIVQRCKRQGLLPLEVSGSIKQKIIALIANLLAKCPRLYSSFSLIYRKIFITYILKRIDRNN